MALFCPAAIFAQGGKYTINGKLGNINPPAVVFLIYNGRVAAKAVVKNGQFTLDGSIGAPAEAYLMLNEAGTYSATQNYVTVYLEPGTITVSGVEDLTKATVSGTKNNDAGTRYRAIMQPLGQRDDALEVKDTAASEAQKRSPQFLKALELANRQLQIEKNEANKRFLLENPASLVSLTALYNYAMYNDYKATYALYNKLSPAIKNSPSGQQWSESLEKMRMVEVGGIAPDFALPDTANRLIKLSSYRGKYVLLDFWASWCPICRESAPGVVKAYKKYHAKNFNILSVSLDKPGDRDKWIDAIHHDGLSWTQVSDLQFWKSPVVSLYKLTALPQNFLIDPNGKIIARDLDSDELAARLGEIFGVKN